MSLTSTKRQPSEVAATDPHETMLALIPHIRDLALCLASDDARAADALVCDALVDTLAGWDRFTSADELRAWLLVVLRESPRPPAA